LNAASLYGHDAPQSLFLQHCRTSDSRKPQQQMRGSQTRRRA
jgi:hypothetical protein